MTTTRLARPPALVMEEPLGPTSLPADVPRTDGAPRVAFRELRALWFQLTGTLCNLACRHCFNASGPKEPWLGPLAAAVVRRHLAEAEALGVRELYFTGGEPFLHPEILPLLEDAMAVAPTTVLTNGTLIDEALADRLARVAAGSPYSLEIRISIDAPTAAANDAVRGHGAFAKAIGAARLLSARGLYPIVTATKIAAAGRDGTLYEALRAALLAAGVERPRIKILPLLPLGRAPGRNGSRRVTPDDLEGFDTTRLQCTATRVVAAGGVYACPILAGLPGARMSDAGLAEALAPTALYHPVCHTCYETGIACQNF